VSHRNPNYVDLHTHISSSFPTSNQRLKQRTWRR